MTARGYGQYCGFATAVELVCERWALLIIRDLLVGPRRYTELKRGLPRIPTNILSARLKELQHGGVIHRVPLAGSGVVYELTEYGYELEPIVLALGRWGFRSMGAPRAGEIITPDSLTMALRTAFRSEIAAAPLDFQLQVGDIQLRAQAHRGHLNIVQIAPPAPHAEGSPPAGEPDLWFAAGPGIRQLIAGTLLPAQAVKQDVVTILRGNLQQLERFTQLFRIDLGADDRAPGTPEFA